MNINMYEANMSSVTRIEEVRAYSILPKQFHVHRSNQSALIWVVVVDNQRKCMKKKQQKKRKINEQNKQPDPFFE